MCALCVSVCAGNIHDNDYMERKQQTCFHPTRKKPSNNKLKLTNLIVPIIELDVEK